MKKLKGAMTTMAEKKEKFISMRFDILVSEKYASNLFREIKNSINGENNACSYTYSLSHWRFRDQTSELSKFSIEEEIAFTEQATKISGGMLLHCERPDFRNDQFEVMFKGCLEYVKRVDELHVSPDSDGLYSFIVWANNPSDETECFILRSHLSHNVSPEGDVVTITQGLYIVTEVVC